MEFKQTTLPNGLHIAAEVIPDAASTAVGFFARTGSRDETAAISGVSHFLEHMMFKGSPTRSALDVNRQFDEIGAEYNASTSEELTFYYAAVIPEMADKAIDLWCDLMRPRLDENDFNMEKQVILDEIARYQDMPYFRAYDTAMETFFKGHPLGQSILGSPESITALTAEQMHEYFRQRYSPGNLWFVAAGKMDFDQVVEWVTERCSQWEPYDVSRELPPVEGNFENVTMVDATLARTHLVTMSPGVASQSKDRIVGSMAAHIFGGSHNSRLFYALVEPGLVEQAAFYCRAMDQAGAFMGYLNCDAHRCQQVQNIYRAEMERFTSEGPTEKELAGAARMYATGMTLSSEMPMGRLSGIAYDLIYRGEYRTIDQVLDEVFAVRPEQIVELLGRVDWARHAVISLGPEEA
jgi:predicted Zn-dependent peptidase